MWKGPASMSIRICAVWLCCLWSQVQCQVPTPYQSLSPDPDNGVNTGGAFIFPAGNTGIFNEGSIMHIQWNTTYPSVNLWCIYQHNISWSAPIIHQFQIVTGFVGTSTDWVVKCDPNCDSPYTLRIVNATGSESEQALGGFWSRLFWIKPAFSASTTSSTGTQSESPTSTQSHSTSTKSSSTPSNTCSSKNGSNGGNCSSNRDTAIGVGVGVGVGVALLLIGGFFLWRRYHKKLKARYSQQPPAAGSHPGQSPQRTTWSYYPPPQEAWSYQRQELPAGNGPKELDGQPKPHELPTNP